MSKYLNPKLYEYYLICLCPSDPRVPVFLAQSMLAKGTVTCMYLVLYNLKTFLKIF